jgi:hypothetical protein
VAIFGVGKQIGRDSWSVVPHSKRHRGHAGYAPVPPISKVDLVFRQPPWIMGEPSNCGFL